MSSSELATLDALFADAVGERFSGIGASVATRAGVVYEGAFGEADRSEGWPLRTDSLFRIASMTKAVTSVAVMQLVERGKVALDAPAPDYVPELAGVQVLERFDASGEPVLRPPARLPTVRELLTHSSGFAYSMWNESIGRYEQATGLPSVFAEGAGHLGAPLVTDPGSRWEYGIGTDWLGRLVECVSGSGLDAYFERHILGPLGMHDTGFGLDADEAERLVVNSARQADGSLIQAPIPAPARGGFCSGGAGLISTVPDYMCFAQMLLHRGTHGDAQILRPETVDEMAAPQLGSLPVERLRTVDPSFSLDLDLFPGTVRTWGLGFQLNRERLEGRRAAGSLTWAGIFNTYFWVDLASGICATLMTQLLPFSDERTLALYEAFEREVYRRLE